ncbi:NAD(P)H nitroreductase [Aggregatibacter actinomycetemcomitans]|uniref:NAD(P)H nitroreductase n=1 Tax=Aggregatibacter actinomycetemcomitans TaxID=714 RepID=UPI001E531BC8|nr:NAD(P)H nitroreductase [Aggregatibacter actinomycetemcomitans]
MDALQLLTERSSEKRLNAPAPTPQQLDLIFQAALRAPDHGKLQPYRFIVIEQAKMNNFSELLKDAVQEFDLGEERLKKAENLATRAPMIIGVVAKLDPSIKKVPEWEQLLCAGCATYAIQLASNALGFKNVWISGPWLDGAALREAFHCSAQDKIIGFVMIGSTEEKAEREKKTVNCSELVSYF